MFYEEIDMFDEAPNIFINKKEWDKMTDSQMQKFKEQIFAHYREHGFPYYNVPEEKRLSKYAKMKRKEYLSLIDDDKKVAQTMVGLGELWTYFPHSFAVQCENMLSPLQAFTDDVTFRKAIEKRVKYGTYISDAGMRKALKITTGVQSVSNFRPTAAAAIYSYFKAKTVWDMSCGYGGRLLGSFISNSVEHYIGTEPCDATMTGLLRLKEDIQKLAPNFNISLYKEGSECFVPDAETLDLCFTSPPYFRTEKYSYEATQSAVKFPEKEAWLNGFLAQTIKNCWNGLKKDKFLVINIANVKAYSTLEDDCVAIAEQNGFKHVDTLYYTLSRIMGSRANSEAKYKLEPVFIFQKVE